MQRRWHCRHIYFNKNIAMILSPDLLFECCAQSLKDFASTETDVTQERKTSPSLHKIGGTIHSHPYKVTKYILLRFCCSAWRSAHQSYRVTGCLGVRIMVWVGTALHTCGMVFQWASTIKTSHRWD